MALLLIVAVSATMMPMIQEDKWVEAATPAPTLQPETGGVETFVPTPSASPVASESPTPAVTQTPEPVFSPAPVTEELRGVWVAFYEYKKAGLKDKSEKVFRKNADKLFQKIKSNGCNAVFFHVRAFDDAIGLSDNFKFSSYMGKRSQIMTHWLFLLKVHIDMGFNFMPG